VNCDCSSTCVLSLQIRSSKVTPGHSLRRPNFPQQTQDRVFELSTQKPNACVAAYGKPAAGFETSSSGGRLMLGSLGQTGNTNSISRFESNAIKEKLLVARAVS